MKFSDFIALNKNSQGNEGLITYTLMEINLVRIEIILMDDGEECVEKHGYVKMNELIEGVRQGLLKIINPETLIAYNWAPEDRRVQIGYQCLGA